MVAASAGGGQDFTFRSDRLSLDFAATLMFRATSPHELLELPASLSHWLAAAGVVEGAPPASAGELGLARRLREAIYRTARASIAGASLPASDVALLNRFARGRSVVPALEADGSTVRRGDAAGALVTIARDAIELLGGPERERLRQCRREGCTRLFLDRTRAGTRVWCGMRECGNRVNAAAYRRRRSVGRAAPEAARAPQRA